MKTKNKSKEKLILNFFEVNRAKTATRIAGVALFIFMTLKACPGYCLCSNDMFFIIDSPAFRQYSAVSLAGNNISENKCLNAGKEKGETFFSGSWNTSSPMIAYELDKSTFEDGAFFEQTNKLNMLTQVVLIMVILIVFLAIYFKGRVLWGKGLIAVSHGWSSFINTVKSFIPSKALVKDIE